MKPVFQASSSTTLAAVIQAARASLDPFVAGNSAALGRSLVRVLRTSCGVQCGVHSIIYRAIVDLRTGASHELSTLERHLADLQPVMLVSSTREEGTKVERFESCFGLTSGSVCLGPTQVVKLVYLDEIAYANVSQSTDGPAVQH